ncbi:hypothetical protein RCH16_000495 [Cryobacterium sp. MP_M5]|uniref:PH domain-containing protein n=1 Tax=unclassified Cryobacterium TaxID=2649013 RepID=UPI0018CB718A|nr:MULTISPECIES: PH domain-containing protein [unclassified Cryobacterium]MBG6057303.1 hypothetical protein [Cryobacterium sp. MP_M3]MEC5175502.1 hypothetical protein [Cryobacterium sp. MP_M5]
MATGAPAVRAITFRANSSVLVFAAVVVACAVLLGDAGARQRWDVVAAALPAAVLVLWAAWLVFLRPCLRVGEDGLTVVNIVRTTVVPWDQVDEVTTRFQTVVILVSGERLRCWGAPTAARPARPGRRNDAALGPDGRMPGSPVQTLVESRLARAGRPAGPAGAVLRRWNIVPIGAGLALALVVAAQLAAAGSRFL